MTLPCHSPRAIVHNRADIPVGSWRRLRGREPVTRHKVLPTNPDASFAG